MRKIKMLFVPAAAMKMTQLKPFEDEKCFVDSFDR